MIDPAQAAGSGRGNRPARFAAPWTRFPAAGYAVLDRLAAGAAAALYLLWFANLLDHRAFGLFVLAETVLLLAQAGASLSVGQALVHLAAPHDEPRAFWRVGVAALALKGQLFAGVAALTVLAGLGSAWWPVLAPARALAAPFLGVLAASMLLDAALQLLQARQDTRAMFHVDTGLLAATVAVLAWATRAGLLADAASALWCLAAARGAAALAGAGVVCRRLGWPHAGLDRALLGRVRSFAMHAFANSVGAFVLGRTDVVMLALLAGRAPVATYAAAIVFMRVFVMLAEPANLLGLPLISRLHHDGQPGRIGGVYVKMAGMTLLAALLPAAVLLLVPRTVLLAAYGGRYAESAVILQVVALWGLLMPVYRCGATVMNGVARPEVNARYTWLAAGLNAVANVPLILRFGAAGAAAASLFGAALLALLFLRVVAKTALGDGPLLAEERLRGEEAGRVSYDAILHDHRYRLARRAIGRAGRVLDCACGSGYGARWLGAGRAYTGVDVDGETVAAAAAAYGSLGRFLQVDGRTLPFADGAFDAVCSLETIEHLPRERHAAFVGELVRVLAPGGMLVLTTPNRGYLFKRLLRRWGWSNPYHAYEYAPRELRRALEGVAGLEVVGWTTIGAPLPLPVPHAGRETVAGRLLAGLAAAWTELGRLFPAWSSTLVVRGRRR